jgi:hypothetical protein
MCCYNIYVFAFVFATSEPPQIGRTKERSLPLSTDTFLHPQRRLVTLKNILPSIQCCILVVHRARWQHRLASRNHARLSV